MGHNMTVASSPLAVGPRSRAVKIPVISPQAWMARLVEKVAMLALEKIIFEAARRQLFCKVSTHADCFSEGCQDRSYPDRMVAL
jgi:hypothetical protein